MAMRLKQCGIGSLMLVVGFMSGCQLPQAQVIDGQGPLGAVNNEQPRVKSSRLLQVELANKNSTNNAKLSAQLKRQVADDSKTKMTNKNAHKLEALSAVSFNGKSIKASVISHGCTTSENFVAEHEVIDGVCQVSIQRTKPDLCRRAPFVADITIQWSQPSECSDLDLTIVNPILVTAENGNLIKRFK